MQSVVAGPLRLCAFLTSNASDCHAEVSLEDPIIATLWDNSDGSFLARVGHSVVHTVYAESGLPQVLFRQMFLSLVAQCSTIGVRGQEAWEYHVPGTPMSRDPSHFRSFTPHKLGLRWIFVNVLKWARKSSKSGF